MSTFTNEPDSSDDPIRVKAEDAGKGLDSRVQRDSGTGDDSPGISDEGQCEGLDGHGASGEPTTGSILPFETPVQGSGDAKSPDFNFKSNKDNVTLLADGAGREFVLTLVNVPDNPHWRLEASFDDLEEAVAFVRSKL